MLTRLFAWLVFGLTLVCGQTFAAVEWRPIDPQQLSLKHSNVDPSADVETLFREVRVRTVDDHYVLKEYRRLKIFTQRGLQYSSVQIPYISGMGISGVEGRTVNPDGSIVELKKNSIFDEVIEKANGLKLKVKSFAMPAVQSGSIIEYQFSISLRSVLTYLPLDVQTDFPVDELTFLIQPPSSPYYIYPAMRYLPFGCTPESRDVDHDGNTILKFKNVPAFHDEPQMPPERSAKQWMLVFYTPSDHSGIDAFWRALGSELYKDYSGRIKVNREVEQLARQITSGSATDHDKLAKLVQYCRTEIKNLNGDNITDEELESVKTNKTSIDTLRHREGSSSDIHFAFAALAQASGFEARVANLADRRDFLFQPSYQSPYFLNSVDVAVKVNGKWEFYDVTNPSLAPGQLRWQEQGAYALIADRDQPQLVQTPVLSSEDTKIVRVADVSLSVEGVLEGEIRQVYLGNKAITWREENRSARPAELETALRAQIKLRFADFDLTRVNYTVPSDPSKSITLTYHIVVRNYAQRTGKRMFVIPNYFRAGESSKFPAAERFNDVYFEYPWSEIDIVQLKLPDGFELDHGNSPNSFGFPPVGAYSVAIGFDKTKNLIVYQRRFIFGKDTPMLFTPTLYPNIKGVFDRMREADNHLLALKASKELDQAAIEGMKKGMLNEGH